MLSSFSHSVITVFFILLNFKRCGIFFITILDFMVLNLHSGIMKNHLQSVLVLLVVSCMASQ